jgi:ABC-type transport system substrate-binding protein
MKTPNRLLSDAPTTIFTVMSALAVRHDAINLGQGFPDTEGPADMVRAAADALLDHARIPTDVAARRALYAKLWEVERADLPLLYLWTTKNVVGMKRGLQGFVQVPDGLIRLRGVTLGR